jgi:glucose/arabinose dehydrogenase
MVAADRPTIQATTIPDGVIFGIERMPCCRPRLSHNAEAVPEKYRGGIFSAQHGSWNRTNPVGARVLFTSLKPDGTADKTEVFAEGWMNEDKEYLGRPVDVQVLNDGSLLVSDDFAGAIWRISYGN